MKKILLFTAAILLTLASCTKNGNGTSGEGSITVDGGVTSVKTVNNGGYVIVKFKADCDWEITVTDGTEEWLEFYSPMNGTAGEHTIDVDIAPFATDNTEDVRTAEITIKDKNGNYSVVIEVIQTGENVVSPQELVFTKEGGEQEFVVYSFDAVPHVEWLGYMDGEHPEVVPDWAELIIPENGENGKYVYKVKVKENTTGAERKADIQACIDACFMISVIQKGE